MSTDNRTSGGKYILLGLVILNGLVVLLLTFLLFEPMITKSSAAAEKPEEEHLRLPAYDYSAWHALPVQTGGRVMPFETACIDVMRQITGRTKFEKNDPVAVVLSWMMYRPGSASSAGFPDWDNYAFILCDHHDLRKEMFSKADLLKGTNDEPTEQMLHGKYVTPKQVRDSVSVRRLFGKAMEHRQKDPEKGLLERSVLEVKADEVMQRLSTFESIVPPESLPNQPGRMREGGIADPFRFIVLDKVHGGAWLSLGLLRECVNNREGWLVYWTSGMENNETIANPKPWETLMKHNLSRMPHLYLDPEPLKDLKTFQDRIRAGTEKEALAELQKQLDEKIKPNLDYLQKLHNTGDDNLATKYMFRLVGEDKYMDRLRELFQKLRAKHKEPNSVPAIVDEIIRMRALEPILQAKNQNDIQELERRIDQAKKLGRYHPEDDRFRDLHMTYLELRVPDIYQKSVTWQSFPEQDAQTALDAFEKVQVAYRSGEKEAFAQDSTTFADTIQTVSKKYDETFPIVSTLDLEMKYNRIEPFRWAWVSMLGTVLLLSLALGTGSRWLYWGAMIPLTISLGFQFFAYYARWMISGRPPVTNMYETVVYVSTMSVIFSLILEFVYRRGYILLAGCIVGTIGLLLADQLPTGSGFDSRISPLNPVLRSNFWLLIHVLTIVASYAAGTLAWGLGNIMLGMYLFGSRKHEHLKMMANFCYKAMQIAVLLLAAGTFLGGWWAAESWGRFWGFDPKENFALLALIVYVIPLHMRYMGWVKDFGMAISAVLCYSAIFMSWYGVNFILPAGLHSYGFGGGGNTWAFWAGTLNLEFVFLVWLVHTSRQQPVAVPAEVTA